jgi:hypothetical protein
MPPKSSLKTTDGGGRRPMKTTLLSQDELVAAAVSNAKCSEPASASASAVAAVASSESVLDKISRNCSSEEKKYLAGLSILEQKVCFIAQDHLESSFDLGRSGGFIAWKNSGGGI